MYFVGKVVASLHHPPLPHPHPSREAAIHAKYSQLPLVYGLIQALLQPVIQGKLLSLVVKHF